MPSFVVTPASHGSTAFGLAFSHSVAAASRILAVVEDLAHDLVFHLQGELQVLR